MTRKYYIPGEIRTVDIPDIDEQELPHSVRLGLREGGTLQCACQNAAEVKEVVGGKLPLSIYPFPRFCHPDGGDGLGKGEEGAKDKG